MSKQAVANGDDGLNNRVTQPDNALKDVSAVTRRRRRRTIVVVIIIIKRIC